MKLDVSKIRSRVFSVKLQSKLVIHPRSFFGCFLKSPNREVLTQYRNTTTPLLSILSPIDPTITRGVVRVKFPVDGLYMSTNPPHITRLIAFGGVNPIKRHTRLFFTNMLVKRKKGLVPFFTELYSFPSKISLTSVIFRSAFNRKPQFIFRSFVHPVLLPFLDGVIWVFIFPIPRPVHSTPFLARLRFSNWFVAIRQFTDAFHANIVAHSDKRVQLGVNL